MIGKRGEWKRATTECGASTQTSVRSMASIMKTMKASEFPVLLQVAMAAQYASWNSWMRLSRGISWKTGFHSASRAVCQKRAMRPFPSSKGWMNTNS